MASVSPQEMFEKAKQVYPGEYRQSNTVWQLVDGYLATKNYAFDGQLLLQSRQDLAGKSPIINTYSKYRVDEAELE